MSPRASKSRKSSTRATVKADPEDKLNFDRKDVKERPGGSRLVLSLGVDLEPITGVSQLFKAKKDESFGDSDAIKREEEKPKNIKSEDSDTKRQEHTKREVNVRFSPTRLWEHQPDGERFIPRPSPARQKPEDVVDVQDFNFDQENVPQENRESSPLSPLTPSPPPQRQPQRYYRDGRALPEVQVLLPRLEDVRRRQAARKPQARGVLLAPGAVNAHQAPRQDPINIKPEPDDDVKALLALEEHDPAEVKEVLRTAVQNLRNPVAKVKKELLLDDEFLLDALTWEGINYKYPIPLPKDVAEFQFKREYISHLYGGNTQQTFPKPRDEMLEWHGLRDWAFLSLDYNPHAPTRPGHSGLFFSSKKAEESTCRANGICRTFVRVSSGQWVYMGQYKMEVGVSLTAESWKQQKQTVRQAWAEGILNASWGWKNCVRIWLRKQRGADTKISKRDMKEGENNLEHIWAALTEEDIIAAYDRGEEEMGTYRMTCVGYEAEFVDVLVRNVPAWVISDREMKAKRRALKGKGKGKGRGTQNRGKGAGSKRKPIEIESDADLEEDEGAKVEVKIGSDDSYHPSTGFAGPSTGRPRRAAGMNKRQRTS